MRRNGNEKRKERKTMTEEINGLLVLPGEDPVPVRFENSVKAIRALIGGHFQAFHCQIIEEDTWLLCDDDGKYKGLDPNFMLQDDIFVGPVLFVVSNELGDDFDDISRSAMKRISAFMPLLRTSMKKRSGG